MRLESTSCTYTNSLKTCRWVVHHHPLVLAEEQHRNGLDVDATLVNTREEVQHMAPLDFVTPD